MRLVRHSSILLVVVSLAFGGAVARVNAQEQPGDVDGNGCIDSGETPEWQIDPVVLAGPPPELADPELAPIDVGPSLYEFTLLEGELYLPGCESAAEAVTVVDGPVTLTIRNTDEGNVNYVTFSSDRPNEQCAAESGDQRFCRIEGQEAIVALESGDFVYHSSGARYEYSLAPTADGQDATPSAGKSGTVGVAAGGVRAAPLAQRAAKVWVSSGWSKPQGCGGDCKP